MNETKRRKKNLLIGFFLILLSIALIVYTPTSKKIVDICSPLFQLGSVETQILQITLMEQGGLYEQVGDRLKEKGYEHHILVGINAKDQILVKVVLANREANEHKQKEIIAIFNDYIIKNSLDPQIFQVKVSNDESINW
ncbi:hypothetical protein [Bacillus sp. FJAT-22090]|uniref:hypothetical protein n=1 Tax=Bacillus sp. FJAT-22090 TaxID=1581038 RepID=UPI0011A73393|nr:hypothetical protein [Bacillus sp. FJAT-22090]